MSDAIKGYADALLAVAQAEGDPEGIKSQLVTVAGAIAGNEELRSTLSDALVPAATRNQIVDDLLANKASNAVRALVGMIVSAGRGGQLSDIVDAFVASSAAAGGKQVATVRTAVALTPDQEARLAQALAATAGGDVELQVVIDPSVVGGAITTIGDTVIDGSVKARLTTMRDVL